MPTADLPAATLIERVHGSPGGRLRVAVESAPVDRRVEAEHLGDVGYAERAVLDEPDGVLEEVARRRRRDHDGDWPSRHGAPYGVIVVATNRLLRDALEATIAATPDLTVMVTAESTDDLPPVALPGRTAQVLLIDVGPSPATTIGRVRQLAASQPDLRIILFDVVRAGPELVDLVEAGVSGLLLQQASADEILSTTRAVLTGATVIPETLMGPLLSHVAERATQTRVADWCDRGRITRREYQIIVLIAEGLGNKEIAAKLNIATLTVKSHVHNVLQKLGLHSRAQITGRLLVAPPPTSPVYPGSVLERHLAGDGTPLLNDAAAPSQARWTERVAASDTYSGPGRVRGRVTARTGHQ